MITPETCLSPNREQVAAKVIDGEAIIMNLVSGSYYSMDGVGAAIWSQVEQGLSLGQLSEWVTASFEVDPERAAGDVATLCAELVDEGLVQTSADAPSDALEPFAGDPREYDTPALVKYTDMADLLALDPPMPGVSENPWLEASDGA